MKKRDKYLLILLIITCCIVCWLTARYYCEIAIPADADLSKEFEIVNVNTKLIKKFKIKLIKKFNIDFVKYQTFGLIFHFAL